MCILSEKLITKQEEIIRLLKEGRSLNFNELQRQTSWHIQTLTNVLRSLEREQLIKAILGKRKSKNYFLTEIGRLPRLKIRKNGQILAFTVNEVILLREIFTDFLKSLNLDLDNKCRVIYSELLLVMPKGLTFNQLCKKLEGKMTRMTVNKHLKHLLKEKIVIREVDKSSKRKFKPVVWKIAPDFRCHET